MFKKCLAKNVRMVPREVWLTALVLVVAALVIMTFAGCKNKPEDQVGADTVCPTTDLYWFEDEEGQPHPEEEPFTLWFWLGKKFRVEFHSGW